MSRTVIEKYADFAKTEAFNKLNNENKYIKMSSLGLNEISGIIIPKATKFGRSTGCPASLLPKFAKIIVSDKEGLMKKQFLIDIDLMRKTIKHLEPLIQSKLQEAETNKEALVSIYEMFSVPPEKEAILESLGQPISVLTNEDLVKNNIKLGENLAMKNIPTVAAPDEKQSDDSVEESYFEEDEEVSLNEVEKEFEEIMEKESEKNKKQTEFKDFNKQNLLIPSLLPIQQLKKKKRGQVETRGDTTEMQNREDNREKSAHKKPLRKVTFEIERMGQLTTFYHDVVKQGQALILIFDHSDTSITHYVPPTLTKDDSEPEAMAILVHGTSDEPSHLYLAYSSGLRFTYKSEEFIILIIEEEKVGV